MSLIKLIAAVALIAGESCLAAPGYAQTGGNVGGTVAGTAGGVVRSGAMGAATGGLVGGGFASGVAGGVVGGMTNSNSTATDDQEATHMLQGIQNQPSRYAPPKSDDDN